MSRIGSYSFGKIEIDGRVYTSDVIIMPDAVMADWWREQGHSLTKADLKAILDDPPDTLVIGTGADGLMKVTATTSAQLRDAGITTECLKTADAVVRFNELCDADEKVAAAFHLTC